MPNNDTPKGITAEAICSNLVTLLRDGYAVRFKSFSQGSSSPNGYVIKPHVAITVSESKSGKHVTRKVGYIDYLSDVLADAYLMTPEVEDAN